MCHKLLLKLAYFFVLLATTQPNSNFCAFGKDVGAVHSGQRTIKNQMEIGSVGTPQRRRRDAVAIETISKNDATGKQLFRPAKCR